MADSLSFTQSRDYSASTKPSFSATAATSLLRPSLIA
ncbi:Uncharacterised protein [Vibrio cholerae]|nr:Uncharacterised protein [Vibrio cholerae]